MKRLSQRQEERRNEFWRGRNASARLGLKVLPLDEIALQKRVELNLKNLYFPPEHPFEWDIPEWTLSSEHLKNVEIAKDKSFKYIDTYESFNLLSEHIKQQNVIALDLEFSEDYSFHKITSLIQISTSTHDFIIDSIVLYNHVNTFLYDVMIDKNILKIFYGTQDVLALQRDFNIRVFPLVDFQNVFQVYKSLSELPGFKYVVENFLCNDEKIDIDKNWQCFNWRLRPLPEDALNYARLDSKLLLECWEKFKFVYSVFVRSNQFPYKHQRNLMLKSFKFPPKQDYNLYFNRAWEQASENFKKLFVPKDTEIFKEIHNWRYNTAKLKDVNVYNLFSDLDILKMSILKPDNITFLDECSYKVQCLNDDAKMSILNMIFRKVNVEIVNETVVSPEAGVNNDNTAQEPSTSSQEPEPVAMETETVVIKKCVTCERGLDCISCKKKGVNNPFNIVAYDSSGKRYTMHDYVNYKIKDKTLINFFAKKKKKLNQICINDHRVKQGLHPLSFGKKKQYKYKKYNSTKRSN